MFPAMKRVRLCVPLVAVSIAGGCATVPSNGPLFVVTPGTGRDQAAFQHDSETCQQSVVAGTGYGTPAQPAASGAAPPAGAWIASEDTGFLQCMAAQGDVVAPAPASYAANYPGFAYGYAYPFGYFDPYPVYFGGIFGGFAFGGSRNHGWEHAGWHHGGWGHGGGGWHGGGHGGGGHGGGHH
jgi:hypothetical protein